MSLLFTLISILYNINKMSKILSKEETKKKIEGYKVACDFLLNAGLPKQKCFEALNDKIKRDLEKIKEK